MIRQDQSDSLSEYEIINNDNEIRRIRFFSILKKSKKVISIFSLAGFLIAAGFAYSTKKTFQGEFQIVIDSDKNQSQISAGISAITANNSLLNNLLDSSTSKKYKLQTEVGILKSPSILKNIFNFVKEQKTIKKSDEIKDLEYMSWVKQNLDIELQKGTNILNIAYRDKDRELIIPVLDKISKAYQNYSGKNRSRNIELGLNFVNKQIEKYQIDSNKSMKNAQEFAIDNDLAFTNNSSTNIEANENIELLRVKASNEIRVINEEIKKFNNLQTLEEKMNFVLASSFQPNDLSKRFRQLNTEISLKKNIYKEDDEFMKKLLSQRNALMNTIVDSANQNLISKRSKAKARYKAASRPKEVIIEYSRLMSKATKDKLTLDNLETQKTIILLEKARMRDPWELITNPTILNSPYGPRKKRIMALGLLTGSFIGTLLSLLIEKNKDKILNSKEVKLITNWKFLAEIESSQKENFSESIELFCKAFDNQKINELSILIIGNVDNLIIKNFTKTAQEYLKNIDIVITNNLNEVINSSNLVILVAIEVTTKKKLISTLNKLSIREEPNGYIVLI